MSKTYFYKMNLVFLVFINIGICLSACSKNSIEDSEASTPKVEEEIDIPDDNTDNDASAITPFEMVQNMGRGINLGNILSAPVEGNWADPVTETYIGDIKSVGFTTVRIPIRFDTYTTKLEEVNYTDSGDNYIGSIEDYKVSEDYLNRIEEVVDWIIANNMVAIIDVHGDHWFWESYKEESQYYKTGHDLLASQDRFRAIWRDISVKFKDKSENLLFEIMNEAYFSMNADEVDFINKEILSIIRATNPTRNVIVTGGGKNSFEAPLQLSTSLLESDDFLIATFHYYKPFNFTSSSKPDRNRFEWGSNDEMQQISADFDVVKNWSITNNIPVFLGEFGADNEGGYDYDKEQYGEHGGPTKESRRSYHSFLANLAMEHGFSFAAWDAGYKSNKTIYRADKRQWVEDIKDALLNE